MGGVQCHELAKESLQLLQAIPDDIYQQTIAALGHRLLKMQMQVSKWDLFMIMQLNQSDIRKMLTWLKGQEDPTSISTHLFMVALILSRPNLDLEDKLFALIDSLCYQGEVSQVQEQEVRYVFALVYQMLSQVSQSPVECPQLEDEVMRSFFGKGAETTSISNLSRELSSRPAVEYAVKVICLHQSTQNKVHQVTELSQPSRSLEYGEESPALESNSGTRSPFLTDQNTPHMFSSGSLKQGAPVSQEALQLQRDNSARQQSSIKMKFLRTISNEVQKGDRMKAMSNISGLWECEEQKKLHEMNFMVDERQEEDAHLAGLDLSEQYASLKDECKETSLDMITPLVAETESVLSENMKVFGSAQLVQLMVCNQFMENFGAKQTAQVAEAAGEQQPPKSFLTTPGKKKDSQLDMQSETGLGSAAEQAFHFGVSFKDFFKPRLQEVQIEIKTQKSQLMTYLDQRGQKRIFESKKYKVLGEIQILQRMLKKVEEMNKIQAASPDLLDAKLLDKEKVSEEREPKENQTQSSRPISTMDGAARQDSMQQILHINDIFTQVLFEFGALRSCGFSRKTLVQFMDLKNEKRQAARIVSFWQGVRKLVEQGLTTFFNSDYLLTFLEYARQKQTSEELKSRRVTQVHFETKMSMDKYNVQVGKLKAYQFITNIKVTNIQGWILDTKKRIMKLQNRVSIADTNLVDFLRQSIRKKRSSRLYFDGIGRMAAYKCITKGLSHEHVVEYLAISLVKMRTWELVYLTSQDHRQRKTQKPISDPSLLLGLCMQMQRMSELETKKESFRPFKEDALTIVEEERLLSEAPFIPQIAPLYQVNIDRSPYENVKTLMKQFYERQECSQELVQAFEEFQNGQLQFATYDLQGTMSYQTLDIEDSGHLIFDFIEVEIENPAEQRDFIDWLGSLSCSLRHTYYQAQVEKVRKVKSDAHKSVKKYAASIASCSELNFQNVFHSQRAQIFDKFMQQLRQSNRSSLVNNFDMTTLSMPLEYSVMNNYWFIQAVRQHLRLIEKKEKFVQISAQKACVLLSQRIVEQPVKVVNHTESTIQQNMTCGLSGPHTISQHSQEQLDKQSQHSFYQEPQIKQEEREKVDWDRQFTMCKGLDILEETVKFELFGDVQEMVEASMTQIESEQSLLVQIFQTKESITDMKMMRSDLQKRYQALAQIDSLVGNYRDTRAPYLDNLKKIAVYGVTRGAVKYLECLIECVNPEAAQDVLGDDESFNQEEDSHLEVLYRYLKHIYEQIQVQFEKTELKVRPRNFPDVSVYPGLAQINSQAQNTTLNISVKKGALPTQESGKLPKETLTPANNLSPNKLVAKKTGKIKSKRRKALKPHQAAEVNLISFLSKKYYLIKLLQRAEKCNSISDWFEWCNQEIDRMQGYSGRLESTTNYLQANSTLEQNGEYQSIQEDEFGCRMLQSVLIGAMVNPVLVFNPSKLFTKANETDLNITDENSGHGTQPGQKRAPRSSLLSKQQISANHLLQFLNLAILVDSKLTSKQVLRNDKLFGYLQRIKLQVSCLDSKLRIQNNLKAGFSNWLNMYNIARTPETHFIQEYKNLYKKISRDQLGTMFTTDESLVRLQMQQIVNQQITELLQTEINKVDYYFAMAMAVVADSDKLDFQTASVKIKKQFDQQMRTFKEMNALEENRKIAQSHFAVSENQERHLEHQVASLVLIVQILKIAKRIKDK